MKGIACRKCGRARVLSDDWIAGACQKAGLEPTEDSIEALLPHFRCAECSARDPLLLWMEVIPTGDAASSGRVCIDCGEFLTVARIKAQADAIRCISCQEALEKAPKPVLIKSNAPTAKRPAIALQGQDAQLFEALRSWRQEEAREAAVSPFIILHDKHLLGVVDARPRTLLALQAIPGLGPHKLNRYGGAIIEIVRRLCPSPD